MQTKEFCSTAQQLYESKLIGGVQELLSGMETQNYNRGKSKLLQQRVRRRLSMDLVVVGHKLSGRWGIAGVPWTKKKLLYIALSHH